MLERAHLPSKNDISYFVKKTAFDIKPKDVVTSNKHELNELSKKSYSNINKRINKGFDR